MLNVIVVCDDGEEGGEKHKSALGSSSSRSRQYIAERD
jgi:hypothetical protein